MQAGDALPSNYGYIPHTLSDDGASSDGRRGDPPFALMRWRGESRRPVGMLKMTGRGGRRHQALAVPIDKLTPLTAIIETLRDLPRMLFRPDHALRGASLR
ncbi:MAG: inorganic diphosphatase [Betaproteobacteria bacterium]|nr:inorganic diphosphatase [Betaproteobacteria bacterium]